MTLRPHLRHLTSALLNGLLLFGLLALTSAAPAAAQTAGKTWEIGFDVGSGAISTDDDFELDLRTDGRLGYFLGDRVQLELQLLRAEAVLDAQVFAALGNVVIQLRPEARVAPYVFGGVGLAHVEDADLFDFVGDEPQEDGEDEGAAYQAGIGARIFFGEGDTMALRVEASSLWTDTDLFGSTRSTCLTVGLSWSFGR